MVSCRQKSYSDIKLTVSAEYFGAVDACLLNIERDGGILFSWKVSFWRVPNARYLFSNILFFSVVKMQNALLPLCFCDISFEDMCEVSIQ